MGPGMVIAGTKFDGLGKPLKSKKGILHYNCNLRVIAGANASKP